MKKPKPGSTTTPSTTSSATDELEVAKVITERFGLVPASKSEFKRLECMFRASLGRDGAGRD